MQINIMLSALSLLGINYRLIGPIRLFVMLAMVISVIGDGVLMDTAASSTMAPSPPTSSDSVYHLLNGVDEDEPRHQLPHHPISSTRRHQDYGYSMITTASDLSICRRKPIRTTANNDSTTASSSSSHDKPCLFDVDDKLFTTRRHTPPAILLDLPTNRDNSCERCSSQCDDELPIGDSTAKCIMSPLPCPADFLASDESPTPTTADNAANSVLVQGGHDETSASRHHHHQDEGRIIDINIACGPTTLRF